MKQIKYIAILVLATLLVGCANDYTSKFSDDWAFVAFEGSTFTVSDNTTTELKFPIYLSSESGLSSDVTIGVVAADTDAVENTHYVLKTRTFTFTNDHNVDTVRLDILNNEDGYGSKVLTIDILNISNTSLKTLTPGEVTIYINDAS